MATKPRLNGLKVLVTRPAQQARELVEQLAALGADVIAFPVIDIVAINPQQWPDIQLDQQDMLVFVSRNAVDYFVTAEPGVSLESVELVAVGASTANALRAHDLPVAIEAPPPAGSESLLAMSAMKNVAGKQVLIVRGESGRELLANTLEARGAKISYLDVYQRRLPTPTAQEIAQAKMAECIIITSVAGLDNVCKLINDDHIKTKKMIVVSDRIRQHAIQLGFQHVYVAEDVKDAAVVQQVIEVGRDNGKRG